MGGMGFGETHVALGMYVMSMFNIDIDDDDDDGWL